MAFKKGQSGNPNGRIPGTPNKATKSIKEAVDMILASELDRFVSEMRKLNGEQYCRVYIKLIEYAVPKMRDYSVETTILNEKTELIEL